MAKRKDDLYLDEEIVAGILAGGSQRQKYTNYLYDRYHRYIYTGIKKYKISLEQAQEAFADALIGVCKQIDNQKFRGESSISSYLFRAFSNRCVDKLRSATSYIGEEELEDHLNVPAYAHNMLQRMELKESWQQVSQLMDELGEQCKRLILDSEYFGFTMDELAQKMGFNKASTA